MNKYDVVIIGASLGGVQAALSACKQGSRVLMTEESCWVGGQLTTQAVPPDEHKWIEKTGCTKSYRKYRNDVREHYRNLDNIVDELKTKEYFCPGGSWVSRCSHEPKVALKILNSYLAPYIESGLLTIKYYTKAVDAVVINDKIENVTIKNILTKEKELIYADYFLDGTDCGDLLPIVKAEYRTGAESRSDYGEDLAPEVGDSEDLQPITWVIAVELCDENDDYKMDKPELYDYFASLGVSYDDVKLFSWYAPDANTHKAGLWGFHHNDVSEGSLGLFTYRRIIAKEYYKNKVNDVSLINWPQNDFNLGSIFDNEDAEYNKYMAKQQSLSFIYYLQNFAKRKDGGQGFPVKLRGDVMGTSDGLALMPYIRESRRIIGDYTIRQQDVSTKYNSDFVKFSDSVGVGHYSIDVHLTVKTGTFFYDLTHPFEIPLGALIPKRIINLIPACKNISCTHLTNGCYRLHPVEWNIGEVAGLLAAYCINKGLTPKQVRATDIVEFQDYLLANGIELHWNKDLMKDIPF